jgi:hypothetical protein
MFPGSINPPGLNIQTKSKMKKDGLEDRFLSCFIIDEIGEKVKAQNSPGLIIRPCYDMNIR